jgi:hypothetical protein
MHIDPELLEAAWLAFEQAAIPDIVPAGAPQRRAMREAYFNGVKDGITVFTTALTGAFMVNLNHLPPEVKKELEKALGESFEIGINIPVFEVVKTDRKH